MFRGTIIAQIIAVLVGIYLAKLYGEEAYGYLGFFISITSIASIIGTLQLDNCIITSNTKEESTNWFNFILIIIPIIIIFLFILLHLFSKLIIFERLNSIIFLLSLVGSVVITYNLTHQSLFTFQKKFSILSNSKIFAAIFNVLFQYILYAFYNILGLIIGLLISQLVLLSYNFYINNKHIKSINFKEVKKGFKSNNTLIKFLLPSNIINSFANNLMPILILTFFGAEKAGVYFFSIKILATPLFLISSSISQVYFRESSELVVKKNDELFSITKKIVISNLIIMLSFLLIINTLGIYILNLYFENQWKDLNSFILILSFLILAKSSFNPISSLIIVLNKNLIGLMFNCYLFLINVVAIYYGTLYNNILYTVIILSLFGGIGYYIMLYYFFNHLKYDKINV
ncbi:lipopolysaccharide biosynthesis protein [Polaribacter reichenbachii]|uniref:lipopolysaccharide biosynthesis protein n=1 Tax=Polaribacter reichenbachii TaxID=996801 RepID=UPI000839144F|nr:oligosaccharide flippase family protein [Polaribacter reichenbachii]